MVVCCSEYTTFALFSSGGVAVVTIGAVDVIVCTIIAFDVFTFMIFGFVSFIIIGDRSIRFANGDCICVLVTTKKNDEE